MVCAAMIDRQRSDWNDPEESMRAVWSKNILGVVAARSIARRQFKFNQLRDGQNVSQLVRH
jgi:hypothetical protein